MKPMATALLSALFFAFAGAASAQQPRGEVFAGETDGGDYVVIVRGERGMSRRDVASSAMLRAAQLTLEADNEWFLVTSTRTQRIDLNTAPSFADLAGAGAQMQTDAFATGTSEGAQAGGHAATAGADPGAVGVGTGVDARVLERRPPRLVYQTIMVFRAGSGRNIQVENPEQQMEIFDAAAVATQLSGSGG